MDENLDILLALSVKDSGMQPNHETHQKVSMHRIQNFLCPCAKCSIARRADWYASKMLHVRLWIIYWESDVVWKSTNATRNFDLILIPEVEHRVGQ